MPDILAADPDSFSYHPRTLLYVIGLMWEGCLPQTIEWIEAAVDVERALDSLAVGQWRAIADYLIDLPPEIPVATMQALETAVAYLGGPRTRS